jgi:hypothetical protein
MEKPLEITWYGRCCFSVVLNNIKILFDPYDRFCNIDMGLVDAEVLLSSSSWHDHGHIGAAPGSYIFTYPGTYEHSGISIIGLEAKEDRGTPTVVFNVQYENISITNFADLGTNNIDTFFESLTPQQFDIVKKTNIAFLRTERENVLKYCSPKLIIPEHYFPRQFVETQIPEEFKQDFEDQNIGVDNTLEILNIPNEEIDDYKYSAILDESSQAKVIKLLKVHPQVKYSTSPEIKKYW